MRVARWVYRFDIVDACAVVAADYRVRGKARCEESCLEIPHKPIFEAIHQRIDRPTLLGHFEATLTVDTGLGQ